MAAKGARFLITKRGKLVACLQNIPGDITEKLVADALGAETVKEEHLPAGIRLARLGRDIRRMIKASEKNRCSR